MFVEAHVRCETTTAIGMLAGLGVPRADHGETLNPFPGGEFERQISVTGGEQPRWRGDGKELYFVGADGKMMAAAVKAAAGTKAAFETEAPQVLFEARLVQAANNALFEYDVTSDGKRFLLNTTGVGSASVPPLTVVVNWDAGLKK